MSDPKPGLFSSFMSGRATKSPRGSETLAHPLLGASTSSLNLSAPSAAATAGGSSTGADNLEHGAADGSGSASDSAGPRSPKAATTGANMTSAGVLPYKAREPRHRHGHSDSASSITTLAGIPSSSTNVGLGVNVGSSPTAGTSGPAPPTTSTSTSTSAAFAMSMSPTSDVTGGTAGSAGMNSSVFGSPSIASGSGNATSRLQLQSMKASAQKLGLGNGSLGMGMVDTVFDKVVVGRRTAEGEWGELLKVLSGGKHAKLITQAVLLLPTTSSSSLPITPQILRDHIAYLSPPIPLTLAASRARSSDAVSEKGKEVADVVTVFTTLSGIVGTIKGSEVSVESILEPSSCRFAHLRDPALRASALSGLRPVSVTCDDAAFPSYTLSEESTSLAFPPLGKGLGINLDGKEAKADRAAGKLGRINPFSSLFGGRDKDKESGTGKNVTPERGTSPLLPNAADRSTSPTPSSPRPSVLSMEVADSASIRSDQSTIPAIPPPEGFTVTAYTINKTIKSSEVQKTLSKSLKTYIRSELGKLPERVVDRVVKLVTLALVPPSAHTDDMSKSRSSISPDDVILALDFSKPAQAGERLQDIMEAVYDDLLQHFRHDSSLFVAEGGLKRKASASRTWSMGTADQEKLAEADKAVDDKAERRRKREERAETQATEGTERVEALVTRLLYNQLFSPLDSDDSKHDEALASRIAALNMLDLSLDHLGLITRPDDEEVPGTIADGLASIINDIGQELQKLSLPTYLTPKEKADVLVAAHQLVVDGLNDLPPIALRPEGEVYQAPVDDQTPRVEQTEAFPDSLELSRSSSTSSRNNAEHAVQEMTDMTHLGSAEAEATPHALKGGEPTAVPGLILTPDDGPSELQIEQAMSESLHNAAETKIVPASDSGSVPEPKKPKKVSKPQNSGADLILPIIIYAVVRSNPPQLASQLMYLRRYRSAICLTGEASYAMVNVTAVVEFLEHVDLAELGLGGESDRVMSIADLSPIGLDYLGDGNADAESIASASTRLRGRVFQVGEMAGSAAGSANKVITGVLDSSWSAMRGLIVSPPSATNDGTVPVQPRPNRPRQASTFSLAGTVASIAAAATTAAARSRAGSRASEMIGAHHVSNGQQWQGNQELVEVVSRPESINEVGGDEYGYDLSHGVGADGHRNDDDRELDDRPEQEEDDLVMRTRSLSDARSIRSVASTRSRNAPKDDVKSDSRSERISLSDRLANIGSLGRNGSGTDLPAAATKDTANKAPAPYMRNLSPTCAASSTHPTQKHARRSSLLSGVPDFVGRLRSDSNPTPSPLNSTTPLSPASSSPGMPITRLRSGSGASRVAPSIRPEAGKPPVNERFMTCEVGDIRLSEVGELLREYRKLAAYLDTST